MSACFGDGKEGVQLGELESLPSILQWVRSQEGEPIPGAPRSGYWEKLMKYPPAIPIGSFLKIVLADPQFKFLS